VEEEKLLSGFESSYGNVLTVKDFLEYANAKGAFDKYHKLFTDDETTCSHPEGISSMQIV